ncbi:uncharacterized protein LOC125036155 [Penaeus chinensis]|uniref:uncharacterized protein LOC125036155 n=1 Tax=Penaeus chinensis TaxID=139456 RepID=UPI001FB839CB|nr:uncharacterized protein LOC125036155 [Penaeus chinensis]XP_047484538.1 uncharacterized protein LOC125036155 [Penaeus chinensis]XP_047484539.1 uncharacterized protein LOC125036155 [Penaeus chinensis]
MGTKVVFTPKVNYDWTNINYIYVQEIVKQAGSLPLDTACTAQELFMSAVQKTGNAAKQVAVGEHVQCQKCNTPWIAGYFTTRLLITPQKKRKRKKKYEPEKSLVSANMKRKNVLVMKCLVCKGKLNISSKIPMKRVMVSETREIDLETTKKKKKKKRKKEMNAGLRLPAVKDEESEHFDDRAYFHSSDAMKIGNEGNTKNQATETVSLMTTDMPDKTNDLENETDRQSEVPEDSLCRRISATLASIKTTLPKSNESNTNTFYVQKQDNKAGKASKLYKTSAVMNKPPEAVSTHMKNQCPKNLPIKTVNLQVNPVMQKQKKVQRKINGLKNAVVKDQMKKSNSLGNFLNSLF